MGAQVNQVLSAPSCHSRCRVVPHLLDTSSCLICEECCIKHMQGHEVKQLFAEYVAVQTRLCPSYKGWLSPVYNPLSSLGVLTALWGRRSTQTCLRQ